MSLSNHVSFMKPCCQLNVCPAHAPGLARARSLVISCCLSTMVMWLLHLCWVHAASFTRCDMLLKLLQCHDKSAGYHTRSDIGTIFADAKKGMSSGIKVLYCRVWGCDSLRNPSSLRFDPTVEPVVLIHTHSIHAAGAVWLLPPRRQVPTAS